MATDAKPQQSAPIWLTFRESPLSVKTVLGGIFVNRLGGFLNIFLVLYLVAEGYSVEQATIGLGVYGGGMVVGVLIGGMLADQLGARSATVIGMAATGVLTAALLYLPTYPLLLLAVALAGLASQIYRPASATLLSDLTPEDRQVMIFALYRFGLNVGATAAPLIGYALYHLDDQHYTLLFWGEALIALAYAAIARATLPPRKRPVADNDAAASASSGLAASSAEPKGGYVAVLRDGRYFLYLIATFLGAAVYVQYLSTLPLDVRAAGLDIFWYTFAVSLNGFIVIAFELLVTKTSQKWPVRVTIGLSYALIGGGVAFYGLPIGPAVIIIGTLIWTLGEILGGPAVFAYSAMAGPAHLKGRYIGSFQFMFGLGSAVGPVVGGALFIQLGHQVWPALAIGEAIGLILVLAAIRRPLTTSPVAPRDPEDADGAAAAMTSDDPA